MGSHRKDVCFRKLEVPMTECFCLDANAVINPGQLSFYRLFMTCGGLNSDFLFWRQISVFARNNCHCSVALPSNLVTSLCACGAGLKSANAAQEIVDVPDGITFSIHF